jgi:DNA-binding winged helix-turn-helix (wHTH) protein/tetratricopeptide (TPR) repeat protein
MTKRRNHTHLSRFIVGDLQVHPDRGCVVRDGEDIPLEPRALQVLEALARKAGDTMTSTQLQLEVWKTDPRIYDDNAVTKTMSGLRKSLGDDARNPRYIETLAGRGYRLIQPVSFSNDYRRLPKPTEPWKGGSPFVGLAAFEATHAQVFAGRTKAIGDVLDAMRGQINNSRRFVLLAGSSGCGKTSLLRAGVLPKITASGGFGGLRALSVATCDLAATANGDAMQVLAGALSSWALHDGVEPRPVFPPQPIESLKRELTDTPTTIAPAIGEAFRHCGKPNLDEQPHAHLLLLIDHAETLVRAVQDPAGRSAFERAVCALCDTHRVLVLMIVRADYAPDLAQTLPVLNERKTGGGHLDLLAPNRGEIAEMIREPAWQASLDFGVDEKRQRLDDALLDAATGQPDALPLLQHTLQRLYDDSPDNSILTWDAYRRIGGLEGAIAHRAEEVFTTLPADAQASLDAVLAKLIVIQSDSDAVTARQVPLESLPESGRLLVEAFVAGRLFVSKPHDGRPHFSVVHEALLRQWPRAVEWVQENRRLLMAKAQLQRAAKRWNEDDRQEDRLLNPGRPLIEAREVAQRFAGEIGNDEIALLHSSEKMRNRKRMIARISIFALATLALVSTSLAVFAMHANSVAERNRHEALELIGYMLVELSDQLRPTASTRPMNSISIRALEFLERQAVEDMEATDLINYSRALRTRGEVLSIAGKDDQANELFRRADAISHRAVGMTPESTEAIAEAAQTAFWLGRQHLSAREFKEAEEEWKRYLGYSRELRRLDPSNPDWWQENAYAIANLAYLEQQRGDCTSALKNLGRATRLMHRAIQEKPDAEFWRFNWIVARSMASRCHAEQGRIMDASKGYAEEIADLKALIAGRPEAIDWEQQLTSFLHLNANLSTNLGRIEAADNQFTEAVDRLTMITRFQPDDTSWKRMLANALTRSADIAHLRGDDAAAVSRLETAQRLAEHGKTAADASRWKRIDANITFRLGRYRTHSDSEKMMASGIKSLSALMEAEASDLHTRIALANALISRGNWLQARGRNEEAKTDWARARSAMGENSITSGNPDILAPWVNASILLGKGIEAESSMQALIASGYAHPDFSSIINRR